MNSDSYYTIENSSVAEYKDKGSKFIAYAFPVRAITDCKEKLAATKKEHPKATHHCFAYRLGIEGNSFRVNDDGEPSGTAGKPILGQIDSRHLTDVLIIVVRYFGGTLLGKPGLIQAYRTAAALALQITPVVLKPVLINYLLQFDYTVLNEVMKIIKQFNCTIVRQEIQLFSLMEIAIPKDWVEPALLKLKNFKIEMETIKM